MSEFIEEKDKDKVIKVLEAKKALLFKWIDTIDELEEAVVNDEDTDSFFDGGDELVGEEYGFIVGCIDENEDGISVFPRFRGQVTLHKYDDGGRG